MAVYEYINEEGEIQDEIYLEPENIVNGLTSEFEEKELVALLLERLKLSAELQLVEGATSYSQHEFQEAIKKLVLNYYQLSQHEENFIINTAKRF